MPAVSEIGAHAQRVHERLAAVDEPKAHRLTVGKPANHLSALYHRRLPHRLVPDGMAMSLARVFGWAEWRLSASRRREAVQRSQLLGQGSGSEPGRRFARRSIIERSLRREVDWRPWMARSALIEGEQQLDWIARQDGGVILASLHLGPFMSIPLAVAHRGLRPYVSGFVAVSPEPRPPQVVSLGIDLERAGGRWVAIGGSFDVLEALLRRGELCHLMLDAPAAKVPSELGGVSVHLSGGVAKLALRTGAAIVPGCALIRRGRLVAELLEPVRVSPEDDELTLTTRVAQRLDPLVRSNLSQWRPPVTVLAPRPGVDAGEPESSEPDSPGANR